MFGLSTSGISTEIIEQLADEFTESFAGVLVRQTELSEEMLILAFGRGSIVSEKINKINELMCACLFVLILTPLLIQLRAYHGGQLT